MCLTGELPTTSSGYLLTRSSMDLGICGDLKTQPLCRTQGMTYSLPSATYAVAKGSPDVSTAPPSPTSASPRGLRPQRLSLHTWLGRAVGSLFGGHLIPLACVQRFSPSFLSFFFSENFFILRITLDLRSLAKAAQRATPVLHLSPFSSPAASSRPSHPTRKCTRTAVDQARRLI